jgi:hypothetical protein
MSDAPGTPAPAAPAAPAPAPAAPAAPAPAPAAPAGNAPEWDGPFDADRAARLIANLREENKGLKTQYGDAQAKLTRYEQSSMSEAEQLAARVQSTERELETLRREKAVSDAMRTHKLSDDLAELLTGKTADEISAQAAKLAAHVTAKPADASALPSTLPVPGNGGDPAAVSQLTLEQFNAMSPADQMAAYRAGRLRNLGAGTGK